MTVNIVATNTKLEKQWSVLLLGLGILLGAFLRVYPVLRSDFPILDGGLFYVAIQSLKSNSWSLPHSIPYNALDIPFVYPPLGLYVTGLFSDLFKVSLLDVIQYLPSIYSILSIFVFYFLAKAILGSPGKVALATAIFALLPRSFIWIILGGGVTRAPGFTFCLLTILNAYHLYFNNQKKRVTWVIVFASLTILSHPDAALHCVTMVALIWLSASHRYKNLQSTLLVGAGVLVLTSPWWGTVLSRYGLAPFLAASKTSGEFPQGILQFLFTNFAEESFLPVLTILSFLGIFAVILRKEYFLAIWFVLPFLIYPRSAATFNSVPMALVCSLFLSDVFIPSLLSIRNKEQKLTATWDQESLKMTRILVGVLLIYSLFSSMYFVNYLPQKYALSVDQRQAMAWIEEKTSQSSRFMILTGEESGFQNPVQEWFPVIAQRESITTVQGREWLSGLDFETYRQADASLQAECLSAGTLNCLEAFQTSIGLDYDYVYLQIDPQAPGRSTALVNTLSASYRRVYNNPEVEIFQRVR